MSYRNEDFWIEVNLENLCANYDAVRKTVGGKKGDYGIGIAESRKDKDLADRGDTAPKSQGQIVLSYVDPVLHAGRYDAEIAWLHFPLHRSRSVQTLSLQHINNFKKSVLVKKGRLTAMALFRNQSPFGTGLGVLVHKIAGDGFRQLRDHQTVFNQIPGIERGEKLLKFLRIPFHAGIFSIKLFLRRPFP